MRLHGLDALRIYAALCVIYIHAMKDAVPFILHGDYAVTLFFVLSGFLLSYRLMEERAATGRIDISGFYRKRARRILPIYFLVLLVSLPFGLSSQAAWLTLALSPHLANALAFPLGAIAHFWSLGVEIWFYALLPQLAARFSWERVGIGLVVVFGLAHELARLSGYANGGLFFGMMRLECMGVGVLFAWSLHQRKQWLKWGYHAIAVVSALGLLFAITLAPMAFMFRDLVISVAFGVVIINAGRFPKLDAKWVRHLGTLTYGIYAWHYILLYVAEYVMSGLPLLVFTTIFSIAMAQITYTLIEKPIMQRRG